MATSIAVITPFLDSPNPYQQVLYDRLPQTISATLIGKPNNITINHFTITGSDLTAPRYIYEEQVRLTQYTNTHLVYECDGGIDSALKKRRYAMIHVRRWLDSLPDGHDHDRFVVWLDADDEPSRYWIDSIRASDSLLNIMSVAARRLSPMMQASMDNQQSDFEHLSEGANVARCGSAIVWNYNRVIALGDSRVIAIMNLTRSILYEPYVDDIEDYVVALEMSLLDSQPNDAIGYVRRSPMIPAIFVTENNGRTEAQEIRNRRRDKILQYLAVKGISANEYNYRATEGYGNIQ